MKPILLIEDDRKIARVAKVYLEGAGFRVLHAADGASALSLAEKEMPLAVILDLMLPDMPGESVCQSLKELGDFPIIMLTAKSSEEERVAGFALGADDYVVKPFSPRELVYRIKAILKRARKEDLEAMRPLSFEDGRIVMDGRSYRTVKDKADVDLTPTEFKILHVLASSPGRVFGRDELVEKALGYQFEGYERTVDAHIKNIRRKLEDDPKSPSFILTIYGVGYRFSARKDDTAPLD